MDGEAAAAEQDIDLKKLCAGEPREFEKLYGKYVQRIYGYAYKISSSRDDAEEITQDIFQQLWQQRQAMRSERLIWVIARHKCIDYLRTRRPPVVTVDEEQLPMPAASTDETAVSEESTQAALHKLAAGEREVLSLLLAGRSRKEIQQLLQLPLGTIDSRLHRLKQKLQGVGGYGSDR